MTTCGNCQQSAIPPVPMPLCQIRHGYRAEWNGLAFSVERESSDWMVKVQDFKGRQTLYTARRSQPEAARLIAAEYGVIRVLGTASRVSAAQLARELKWQEYW